MYFPLFVSEGPCTRLAANSVRGGTLDLLHAGLPSLPLRERFSILVVRLNLCGSFNATEFLPKKSRVSNQCGMNETDRVLTLSSFPTGMILL